MLSPADTEVKAAYLNLTVRPSRFRLLVAQSCRKVQFEWAQGNESGAKTDVYIPDDGTTCLLSRERDICGISSSAPGAPTQQQSPWQVSI